MSSAVFTFDAAMAREFGVNEAILIGRLQVWIRNNFANKRNMHDGRTWTYNTRAALAMEFPYWSEDQIWRLVKSLVERGVLMKADYNKKAYDRTTWYAFVDEKKFLGVDFIHCAESRNGVRETAQSTARNHATIPTIKPTIHPEELSLPLTGERESSSVEFPREAEARQRSLTGARASAPSSETSGTGPSEAALGADVERETPWSDLGAIPSLSPKPPDRTRKRKSEMTPEEWAQTKRELEAEEKGRAA